jgi:hypothetical protein
MRKVDICDRLRLAPANLIGTDDEERYWVCHDAAREIERLRLTDAEREAMDAGADALESLASNDSDGRIRAALIVAANTLRGFLKRTG